jgi:hypothetical protein
LIVKFFKYGTGDSTSCFNYLLNERVENNTSRVLRGSPEITKSIISSLTTKRRYKAGCLSFSESNITQKHKEEIMDLFEQTIFPGLPKMNTNICWIEHTDKGRLELNFVIPRVELLSGKAFNPYFHRVDLKRFSAFRNVINKKYNLTNPLEKEQTIKLGDLIKYSSTEKVQKIDTYIQSMIKKGHLHNQSDVVNELKKLNFVVTRVGKEYISIKTHKTKKAIRLKGRHYSQCWIPKEIEKHSLKELYSNLQDEIKKASVYNQNKYYGGLNIDSKNEEKIKRRLYIQNYYRYNQIIPALQR